MTYEFGKVFGYFLEIRCDDAGIITYYLLLFILLLIMKNIR